MPRAPQTTRSPRRPPPPRQICPVCNLKHTNLARHIKTHQGIKRPECLCYFCDKITSDSSRSAHIESNHFPKDGQKNCEKCFFEWTLRKTAKREHEKYCSQRDGKGPEWMRSRYLGIWVRHDFKPEAYLKYYLAALKGSPDWAISLHREPLPFGVSLLEALKAEVAAYVEGLRELASFERAGHLEELRYLPPQPAPNQPPNGFNHTLHSSQPVSTHSQVAPFQHSPQDAVASSSSSNIVNYPNDYFGRSPFEPVPPATDPYLPQPIATATAHDRAQLEPTRHKVNLNYFEFPEAPPAPDSGHPSFTSHSLGRSQLSHRKAAIYGMLQPLSI